MIIEQDEDGMFVSEVIGLPGCHTQGATLDELMKNTKEAISLYLKCKKVDINLIKEMIEGIKDIIQGNIKEV